MKTLSRFLFLAAVLLAISMTAQAADRSLFDEAVEEYRKGRYSEVVQLMNRYVEETPDPAAYFVMGYAQYALGRHDEATLSFQDAFLVDPGFEPQSIERLYGPPGIWKSARKKPVTELHLLQGTVTVPEGTDVVVMEPPPRPSRETGESATAEPVTAAGEPVGTDAVTAPPETVEVPVALAPPETAPAPPETSSEPVPAPSGTSPAPPPAPPMPKEFEQLQKQLESQNFQHMQQFEGQAPPMGMGMIMGFIAGFMMVFLAIGAVIYIFYALCLFLIAKKLEIPNPWIAWIPIAQIWTFVSAAGKPASWILVLFSPLLGSLASLVNPMAGAIVSLITLIVVVVAMTYLWMCISENLGKNKWLGLLSLVPFVQFIFMGYLAFSKMGPPPGASEFSFEETEADQLFDEEEPQV